MRSIIYVSWNKIRVLHLLIMLAGVPCLLNAQQRPVVQSSSDRQTILIGEQFTFTIKSIFPENSFTINFPPAADSLGHFELIGKARVDTVEKNGMLEVNWSANLTTFDSGKFTLPALALAFEPYQGDSTIQLNTIPISIEVRYAPADSLQTFHDIKPIIEINDALPWWVWIAGLVIFVFLVLIARKLWMERKRKTLPGNLASLVDDYEEAKDSLEKLRNSDLLEQGHIKEFHSMLVYIFKRYISKYAGKNYLSSTTDDLLVGLNDAHGRQVSSVAGSMRMSDAVKFAKYHPAVEESLISLKNIVNVIEDLNREKRAR